MEPMPLDQAGHTPAAFQFDFGPVNTSFSSGSQTNNTITGGQGHKQWNAKVINFHGPGKASFSSLIRSLAPADPWQDHSLCRRQHEPETGSWLLQSEQYTSWLSKPSGHLWLHGKPGCGKTILCSCVIEDLRSRTGKSTSTGIGFFYITFSDDRKRHYDDLVMALLAQLGERADESPLLDQVLSKLDRGQTPNTDEMECLLFEVMASYDEVFIVIDALDECLQTFDFRLSFPEQLKKLLQRSPRCKLFASSRSIPTVRAFMSDMAADQILITSADINHDMQKYVTTQMAVNARLREFTPEVREAIEHKISESADGMFHWVHLLLGQLTMLNTSGPSTVRKALESFPPKLSEVYTRMLRQIEDRRSAWKLLCWLVYAKSPPTLGELVDVLIIDLDREMVDFVDRGQFQDILRILSSFIVVMDDAAASSPLSAKANMNTRVRLAHYTMQEYLESNMITDDLQDFRLNSLSGHRFLLQSCLLYILCYDTRMDKTSTRRDLASYPLLGYAVQSWYYHSSYCGTSDVHITVSFLQSEERRTAWLRIYRPDDGLWFVPEPKMYFWGCALYYACFLGLDTAVHTLLSTGQDVNAPGGFWHHPLTAAAIKGHSQVVVMLLDHVMSIESTQTFSWSICMNAVRRAVRQQRARMTGALLDYTVSLYDLDHRKELREAILSALHTACSNADLATARIIIDHHPDLSSDSQWIVKAFHHACYSGCADMVELLLDHSVDINIVDRLHGATGLHYACQQSQRGIVSILIRRGADLNIVDAYAMCPLDVARLSIDPAIVTQDLLAAGGLANNPARTSRRLY